MNENGTTEHKQPAEVEASAHDALVMRDSFPMPPGCTTFEELAEYLVNCWRIGRAIQERVR